MLYGTRDAYFWLLLEFAYHRLALCTGVVRTTHITRVANVTSVFTTLETQNACTFRAKGHLLCFFVTRAAFLLFGPNLFGFRGNEYSFQSFLERIHGFHVIKGTLKGCHVHIFYTKCFRDNIQFSYVTSFVPGQMALRPSGANAP